jgi:hypothetical protein
MSDTERLYNNIGVQALAILLVVQHTQNLPISKALLVWCPKQCEDYSGNF